VSGRFYIAAPPGKLAQSRHNGPASGTETTDMLFFERYIWRSGLRTIAGVDEVGRGALAGPLVAAAVVLPTDIERVLLRPSFWDDVRDSKTLSPKTRADLACQIVATAHCIHIAMIPAAMLDDIGLAAANRCAMERAVLGLAVEPDLLLIDAMTLDLPCPQVGIIDGDAKSLSIAAASIVAKVARDDVMIALDRQFPAYGFARNKGYGTAAHLRGLALAGSSPYHRMSFGPVRQFQQVVPGRVGLER
jgi:ribonuclease HII